MYFLFSFNIFLDIAQTWNMMTNHHEYVYANEDIKEEKGKGLKFLGDVYPMQHLIFPNINLLEDRLSH